MQRALIMFIVAGLMHVDGAFADVSAQASIQAALQALDHSDLARAQAAITAATSDSSFPELDATTRHMAASLAAQIMLRSFDWTQAQRFARDATDMHGNDVDDWRNRLTASVRLGDARDQAICVAAIFKRWGEDNSVLPSDTVFGVFANSDRSDLSDVELDMLQSLYQHRWHPAAGTASSLWLALARLLLDNGQRDAAVEVAAQVDGPDDVIVMRADKRFRSVLRNEFVRSDPHKAAIERIKSLQKKVAQQPRSLDALRSLLNALIDIRLESEAVVLAEEADSRLITDVSAYDDVPEKYPAILAAHARALRHLGRNDDALSQLRRAVALRGARSTVNQQLNLALLLCSLDLPDDALRELPPKEKASAFGNALIALVQLTAGAEKGDVEKVDHALDYLRIHKADDASMLQTGLLRAGRGDEAREVMLWRLNDPAWRGSALREMQEYAEVRRTPIEAQWHARAVALRTDPTVLTAAAAVGDIHRYAWRYDPYD